MISDFSGKSIVIYLAHPISDADGPTLQRKDNLKVVIQSAFPNAMILDPSDYNLRDEVDGEDIIIKNKMDILRSDVVVADLMKASIGTSMECLFAVMNQKKVIIMTGSRSAWVHQLTKLVASDDMEVIAHLNLNI